MATLYKTDDTVETVRPANGEDFTLEELQGFIGGYIEKVNLNAKQFILCDEDGKSKQLHRNSNATLIWQQAFPHSRDVLLGPVLVFNVEDNELR